MLGFISLSNLQDRRSHYPKIKDNPHQLLSPRFMKDQAENLHQAKLTQLNLLQTRIGLHGNRMWQLPLTYLGLFGLSFSKTSEKAIMLPFVAIYFGLFAFGFVLLICFYGAYEGYTRTAKNMVTLEEELGLNPSTAKPWSHSWPYFGLLVLGTLLSLIIAIYFYLLEKLQ